MAVRRVPAVIALGYYNGSYPPAVWTADPIITAPLVPTTRVQNSAAAIVTVNGSNFATDAVILVDGIAQTTTRVSGSQLTTNYAPGPIGTGSRAFQVRNVSVNEVSNTVNLTVTAT